MSVSYLLEGTGMPTSFLYPDEMVKIFIALITLLRLSFLDNYMSRNNQSVGFSVLFLRKTANAAFM